MLLDRPAIDADCVVKVNAIEDIVLSELILAAHAACLANADLRGDVRDIGALEARCRLTNELERVPHLSAAFELAIGKLACIDAADGAAVGIADLREVGAPLHRIRLGPHDRLLARKFATLLFRSIHQLGDALPGIARLLRVDAADAVHGGWIKHVALAVADLAGRAGPRRKIAVARSVDE